MQLYINRKFYRFICAWYKRPSSFGVATPRALTVFADFECTKKVQKRMHKSFINVVSHMFLISFRRSGPSLPCACRLWKGNEIDYQVNAVRIRVVLTTTELAPPLLEEMAFGRQRADMSIATFFAPEAYVSWIPVKIRWDGRMTSLRPKVCSPLFTEGHGAFFALRRISAKCSASNK